MTTPVLIGIHGVKRAGKDTTAYFFTKLASESDPALSVARRGFADKAKWAFARQFFPDITMDAAITWIDKYKESSHRFVLESPKLPSVHDVDVSFREALAQFCTEGARDIYGKDFWVDQLLPVRRGPFEWYGEFDHADLALISDLRFDNEAARISALDGYNIKIKRKDAEDAVIAEAAAKGRNVHLSELGLPDEMFDCIIDNSDNDLAKAFERTRKVWEQILDD